MGVNLSCYGSVLPTKRNMQGLVSLASDIEREIGRKLDYISGGASTSAYMAMNGTMPYRINLLRLGDIGLRGETDNFAPDFLETGVMTIKAEVIECRDKPSFPVGELGVNAFGEVGHYEDRGIRRRALVAMGRVDYGNCFDLIPRMEGIEVIGAQENFEVVSHRGCGVLPADADNIPCAVAAVRNADAIVPVVGDVYAQYGETKDRADLALSGRQLELYRELRALGIPLVAVLLSSKPLAIPEIAHATDALVCAFNGGMSGGQAVAEAIFGRLNPSGRLPISFPHHSGQVPVYYNHLPGWHWGHYSDLPAEPLFTFGEGIGYAPFVYRDLAVDADALTLSVKVRNAGDIAGEETVQVYLRDCVCEVMQPVKQLIAFRKVLLQPGEEQEVTFHLDRTAFTYINRAEERVFAPGDFMLMAGHSAKDEDLLKETVWVG